MISMKSELGMGLFLIKISKSSPTCTKSLFLSMNFINLLTFCLFLGHVIEIFLRILFLTLFQRGLAFAPFLDFSGGRLIFPPCPRISFLVLHSAFFVHTRLFHSLPSSFFLCRGIWPFWSSPAFLMSLSLVLCAFWVQMMLSLVSPSFWVWMILSLVSRSFREWTIFWRVLPVLLMTVFSY